MPEFRAAKPRFRVSLAVGYAQTSGGHDIVFDTLDFEEGGSWDGVSHFTVDRPGAYMMGLQVLRSTSTTASPITARLRRNDVDAIRLQSPSVAGTMGWAVQGLLELDEGDTLAGNVTLHSSVTATVGPTQTLMWAYRAGPKRWTG